jgi:hypothetical protein
VDKELKELKVEVEQQVTKELKVDKVHRVLEVVVEQQVIREPKVDKELKEPKVEGVQ